MSMEAVVELPPPSALAAALFEAPAAARALSSKRGERRSLWRSWKQLSRFQRSLLYMVVGVALVVAVFYYFNLEGGLTKAGLPKLADKFRSSSSKEVPQEQQQRQHHRADEDRVFGLELPSKDDADDRPRNRVEAVHDAIIEAPAPAADGGAGVVEVRDDEGKNGAHEEKEDEEDEDEDEEDYPEDKDQEEQKQEGDGSNQAGEVADPRLTGAAAAVQLPPRDGSLTFGGPQNARQEAVVSATRHAWSAYRAHAWGMDHLKPISRTGQDWFGLGLTIVDSLDTLLVMGMKEEFGEAREWVARSLDFSDKNKDVNLFETTIRVLGGLLSAYHLSGGDKVFLERSKDLGDRLLGAFKSPSGVPYSDVNLQSTRGHAPRWSPDSSTSEVTTIQLEFRDLSRATGDPQYEEAAAAVSRTVHDQPREDGLVPIFINANSGKLRRQATITLGARGDSYYEYLLKQWLQTGKTADWLRADFVESILGVQKRLAKRTVPNNLLYLGEILSGGKDFKHKMDELTCFLPGTVALCVHHECGLPAADAMRFAEELAYTCYLTFARQPTHLAAEITYYNPDRNTNADFYVKPNDSHYLLRPETIESLWYLYYVTGNRTYQEWGWEIFQGIEKYCRVQSGGYTTIGNVRNALDTRPKNMMESFLLGETFKYLYLLFADRHEVPLDRWVLNTEAHLLPIYPE